MEEEEKSEGGDLDVIAPVRVSYREDEIRWLAPCCYTHTLTHFLAHVSVRKLAAYID
jgi:hypothetical protein